MQYLSVVMTTNYVVDIGGLDITDWDDLTDDQVLGLFDAYEDPECQLELESCEWENECDVMELRCYDEDGESLPLLEMSIRQNRYIGSVVLV